MWRTYREDCSNKYIVPEELKDIRCVPRSKTAFVPIPLELTAAFTLSLLISPAKFVNEALEPNKGIVALANVNEEILLRPKVIIPEM